MAQQHVGSPVIADVPYDRAAWIWKRLKSKDGPPKVGEVASLVNELRHGGLLRDSKDYNVVIGAFGRGGAWQESIQLLKEAKELLLDLNVYMYGSVANALQRAGHWTACLQLLEDMTAAEVPPSVITYSTCMAACRRANGNLAVRLFDEMCSKGLTPDKISFNSAISACASSCDWTRALSILSDMQNAEHVQPDIISYSAAMTACQQAGQWPTALELLTELRLKQLQPDVVAFGTALSACGDGGQWQGVLGLVDEMLEEGKRPNLVALNSAISACARSTAWQEALDLFRTVEDQDALQADTITFNSMLDAFSSGGQWQLASLLFEDMLAAGVNPDIITFTAIIGAFSKAGLWQQALNVFNTLEGRKICPNIFAYNALLSALEKVEQWQLSLDTARRMRSRSIVPNQMSYASLLSVCEKAGIGQSSLACLADMKSDLVRPTGIHYGAVVSSLNKASMWQQATSLIDGTCLAWMEEDADIDDDGSDANPEEFASQLPPDFPVTLLAEAAGVCAVSKPAGVATQDFMRHVEGWLQRSRGGGRISVVSRLDYHTSGVIVASLGTGTSAATSVAQAQFAGRVVSKEYLCLAVGPVLGAPGSKGRLSSPILCTPVKKGTGTYVTVSQAGRASCTSYEVLQVYPGPPNTTSTLSLILAKPETGRTHQIRVHGASVGRPVVCDRLYGSEHCQDQEPWCHRMFLHCRHVSLRDASGSPFVAEAPLDRDLVRAVTRTSFGADITEADVKRAGKGMGRGKGGAISRLGPPTAIIATENSPTPEGSGPADSKALQALAASSIRLKGTIKSFNSARGFGFVSSPDVFEALGADVDIFLHHLQVPGGVNVGDEVTFCISLGKGGQPTAAKVQPLH
eukprot:TRINITY_DN12079_c0_g1_i1.p1 TRINITY_DN12079_c0_g1~~TRINITY_DN12079_c0_g1_i1.p1  ORF type:complete len:861 (-),score=75.29 TRINITY_DN12079_c0_g1_i1:566-3148(-)